MKCPFCGATDTAVKDSRPAEDNAAVRRRRFCSACGGRFTTFERVQLREVMVIKRDGRRIAFDRDKLVRSVQIAMRKRPVEEGQLDRMVSGIARRLESSGETEIESSDIGAMVMEALASVDPVAYVRYASVYRDFNDVGDFAQFIRDKALEDEPGEPDAD